MVMRPIDFQDPINWGESLNKGLIRWFLTIPNDRSKPYDLCRNGQLSYGISTHPSFTGQKPIGGYASHDISGFTTAIPYTFARPDLTSTSGFTQSQWLKIKSPGSGGLWGKWDDGSGVVQQFARWSGGIQWFMAKTSGASGNVTVGSAGITQGGWNFVVAVADGTDMTLYVFNEVGKLTTATATLVAPYLAADTVVWKMGYGRTNSGGIDALDDTRIHNRGLSRNEVNELHKEARQGYPRLLSRLPLAIPYEPPAPPAGNRRRRVLIGS